LSLVETCGISKILSEAPLDQKAPGVDPGRSFVVKVITIAKIEERIYCEAIILAVNRDQVGIEEKFAARGLRYTAILYEFTAES